MKFFLCIFVTAIFINISNASNRKATELEVSNKETVIAFIEETVFIIKEHSGYALAHPGDLDNSIRHLEHTCHAINPNLVKKRPMPAPDIGLIKALEIFFDKTAVEPQQFYKELLNITKNSINICKLNLYSNNLNELNNLAKYINFQYDEFYKILKNE